MIAALALLTAYLLWVNQRARRPGHGTAKMEVEG